MQSVLPPVQKLDSPSAVILPLIKRVMGHMRIRELAITKVKRFHGLPRLYTLSRPILHQARLWRIQI